MMFCAAANFYETSPLSAHKYPAGLDLLSNVQSLCNYTHRFHIAISGRHEKYLPDHYPYFQSLMLALNSLLINIFYTFLAISLHRF